MKSVPETAGFSKGGFWEGRTFVFVWAQAFVCRCLCWRWENKGLNSHRGKEEGCPMHERGATERFKSIPLLHLPHPILSSSFCPATDTCLLYGGKQRNNHLSLLGKKVLERGSRKEPGSFQVLCPELKAREGPLPAWSQKSHCLVRSSTLPLSPSSLPPFSLPPTFHPVSVYRDSEGASEICLYSAWRPTPEDFSATARGLNFQQIAHWHLPMRTTAFYVIWLFVLGVNSIWLWPSAKTYPRLSSRFGFRHIFVVRDGCLKTPR